MIRFYLMKSLLLPMSQPICAESRELQYVLDNMANLVVKKFMVQVALACWWSSIYQSRSG
jgi:uncharacterized circularly permuted ATP-grasp superfamily protein